MMIDIIKDNLTSDELDTLNNTDNFGDALMEYHNIVKDVASEYNNDITPDQLRAEHPELDFMDDEDIENILRHAKSYRRN